MGEEADGGGAWGQRWYGNCLGGKYLSSPGRFHLSLFTSVDSHLLILFRENIHYLSHLN